MLINLAEGLREAEMNQDDLLKEIERLRRRVEELEGTEEVLHEREEQYRNIFESVSDGLLIFDMDGRVVEANPSACTMHGYSREEMVGMNGLDLVHPDFHERFGEFCKTMQGEVFSEEPLDIRKDGSLLPLQVRGTTFTFFSKNHVLAVITDITERKKVQEELRAEKEFTDNALNSQRDTFFLFDHTTGRAVRWNRAFSDVTGYTDDEIAEMKAPDSYYGAEDLKRARIFVRDALERGDGSIELELICKDGRKVPYEYDVSAVKDAHGSPTHLISIGRDVTTRKIAEESAALEKKRFQALADNSPFGLAVIEGDGTFRYINPKFQEMFGFDLQDVPNGKEWFKKAYLDSQYRHEVIAAWLEDISCSGVGEQRPRVFTVRCKDGREKIVHFRPVQLETGEHVMTCEDITERKAAEKKLRDSEIRYRELVETVSDGIVQTDSLGTVTFANEAYCRMLGFTIEEMIGESILDFQAPDSKREEMRAYLDYVCREKPSPIPWFGNHETRDGGLVFVQADWNYRLDHQGHVSGFISVVKDITERQKAEEQFKNSLREKEVLLREIHHRVKNNLAVIIGLLRLQSRQAKDEYHRRMFIESQERIRSMALAHEKLYQSENLSAINSKDYLTSLAQHLMSALGHVGCKIELQRQIAEVDLDLETGITLGLIVTELMSNSLKHGFPDGRAGTISLTLKEIDDSTLELSVADDGVGLAENIQLNKPNTLGLDLVRIFARQLRGQLEVRRDLGTESILRFHRSHNGGIDE